MKALVLCLLVFGTTLVYGSNRWERIGPQAGTIQQIFVYPANRNILFVINDSTLYRSSDGGVQWQKMPITNAMFVQVAPSTGTVFVLSYTLNEYDYGSPAIIWFSNDRGTSFMVYKRLNHELLKLFVDPLNSNFMIGIQTANLAISRDGGFSWQPLFRESDFFVRYFEDVLFSPFDAQTVYASGIQYRNHGGSTGITLESADLGNHWRVIASRNLKFVVDPLNSNRVFGASCKGVFQLKRMGWQRLSHQPIYKMAIVPGDTQLFYGYRACQYGEADFDRQSFWKSQNGGKSWTPADFPYPTTITELASTTGFSFFVGTTGAGVFRTKDTQHWQRLDAAFHESQILKITGNQESLYGSSIDGRIVANREFSQRFVFGRLNGTAWKLIRWDTSNLGNDARNIDLLETNPSNSSQVFIGLRSYRAGAMDILLHSEDAGKSWSQSELPGGFSFATQMSFDPYHSGVIFLGQDCKSSDGGKTFSHFQSFSYDGCTAQGKVLFDSNDPSAIYFHNIFDLYISRDGGTTLELFSKLPKRTVRIAQFSGNRGYLALTHRGTFFRSEDGGKTWIKLSHLPFFNYWDFENLAAADQNGMHIFVILDNFEFPRGRMYESVDGGRTWRMINEEFGNGAGTPSVYSFTDPSKTPFYVATSRGVFRSRFPQ